MPKDMENDPEFETMEEGEWAHGCVFWSELNTHDVEKAKKFYEATLGWRFDSAPMEEGEYWMITCDGEVVGGAFELKGPEMAAITDHWMTYIAVDDVDARVKKAAEAGASVIRAPFDVAEVGRIAILREPGGAVIGWITPLGGEAMA